MEKAKSNRFEEGKGPEVGERCPAEAGEALPARGGAPAGMEGTAKE
jgi:hypothetical protein